jgi:hypothetical protein
MRGRAWPEAEPGGHDQPLRPDFPNGASNPVSGCTTVPGALIDEMERYSGESNVVVDNQQFPAGAIRGQLGCANLLFNSTCSGP